MASDQQIDPIALAGIGASPAFLAVVEQARELARIPGRSSSAASGAPARS